LHGIAAAALAGASRQEILAEALHELRATAAFDRLGIWLDAAHGRQDSSPAEFPSPSAAVASHPESLRAPVWRGLAWDCERSAAPREWEELSAEAPIPHEVLLGVRPVAQEFAAGGDRLLIGLLLGLRRVLWTPISGSAGVVGVLLCGARDPGPALPAAPASRLAAELALHLAWLAERSIARERYADLALARRFHAQLHTQAHTSAILAGLADSMVAPLPASAAHAKSSVDGALTAAFVTIGVCRETPPSAALTPQDAAHASVPAVDFRWKSGDPDWLRVAQGDTLAETWQEALRTRRTTGLAPQLLWMRTPIARIVAVPILAEGALLGVLLAGLARSDVSLAVLERLEFRATLAGLALARLQREQQAALAVRRQRSLLASTPELLFILDDSARIVDLTPAAAGIVREAFSPADHSRANSERSLPAAAPSGISSDPPALADTAGQPFAQLFRSADRSAVAAWLSGESSPAHHAPLENPLPPSSRAEPRPDISPQNHLASNHWIPQREALTVHLRSGARVSLRHGLPTSAGRHVVALEPRSSPRDLAASTDLQQTLQSVIDWLEEGVVLFDAHGRVHACNARFTQFAGLPPGASPIGFGIDQLIASMLPQAADPHAFAERWRALARGAEGGVRDELRMLQPAPRILERASRPVLDSAGRFLGRVEIYRDLTAQRLFQSQLLQTEKLAALGQMVTGVAHELSNPLTSILGYAQRLLLRDSSAATEVRQIFQEAERAGGILRQLLFTARETPPERRRVALNPVVLRSMDLQRFSMSAEQIRVELDLDPALPTVLGDAAQLQQVLMNLVGNARQAIQQLGRGGVIRVRTRQIADRRIQLTVEDDGPGVPQSILARIFDPFFTTKGPGVGTGLGLSIVLSIVREHGGSVNVLRGIDGGAVFSIELPAAAPLAADPSAPPLRPRPLSRELPHASDHSSRQASAVGAAPLPRVAPPAPLAPPAPSRVLVVEDEPTVARLIADVLQDEGFSVAVLLDSQEALHRAEAESFDLVICDMKMPGLDGQRFFQRLAASGHPLSQSFLFVTGDVIAPATLAFLERHGLPHLAKPFRVEELTARVRQVLEDRIQHAAVGPGVSRSPGPRENAAGR
jgi:signal transduction histidine kinase/ActR/RegA family two-component response regulator